MKAWLTAKWNYSFVFLLLIGALSVAVLWLGRQVIRLDQAQHAAQQSSIVTGPAVAKTAAAPEALTWHDIFPDRIVDSFRPQDEMFSEWYFGRNLTSSSRGSTLNLGDTIVRSITVPPSLVALLPKQQLAYADYNQEWYLSTADERETLRIMTGYGFASGYSDSFNVALDTVMTKTFSACPGIADADAAAVGLFIVSSWPTNFDKIDVSSLCHPVVSGIMNTAVAPTDGRVRDIRAMTPETSVGFGYSDAATFIFDRSGSRDDIVTRLRNGTYVALRWRYAIGGIPSEVEGEAVRRRIAPMVDIVSGMLPQLEKYVTISGDCGYEYCF